MKNNKAYACLRLMHVTVYALFFTLFLFSCKKEKPPVPDPVAPIQCWDKFIGNYVVYDTINDTTWTMVIEYIIDTNFAGEQDNFLNVVNFNNEFDFHTQFICRQPSTSLSFGILYPAYTHNGKRYNLSGFIDDTTTLRIENNLLKDTIVFYFRKENTLYWMADAVIYEDGWHKHIAIKQH